MIDNPLWPDTGCGTTAVRLLAPIIVIWSVVATAAVLAIWQKRRL